MCLLKNLEGDQSPGVFLRGRNHSLPGGVVALKLGRLIGSLCDITEG